MSLLDETIARIVGGDPRASAAAAAALDAKTKPVGSLGRFEELACRIASIRGSVPDHAPAPAIVVAAADHGVARAGVSAYPPEVTAQMLANFASGGAAVAVLAREAGARLVVVDAGVHRDRGRVDGIVDATVDGLRGTDDLSVRPAMSRSTATGAIGHGIGIARHLADEGLELIAVGEMGIGNTTAASAMTAALTGAAVEDVTGPGTGIDADGLARKVEIVRQALDLHGLGIGRRHRVEVVDVLARVGGLEIAFLVGVILGAAARRVPVVLDGFITGVAALVAARLAPRAVDATIAATRSPEPGHDVVLEALGLRPILDLDLRLGEGSGAALALPIVRAAVTILTDMATFSSAGVSERSDDAVPMTSA
ncbi:MAG TPA: nicotinate-nucleotide--dimethylbenzimidazole phosphoribosyltransferase [Actinomycetota bacterium]|nr:nicotinate-nucleotide--dimethylbenzimidazole phosphoribosyltransferase [Actinomycetota bacterium]